MNPSTIIVIVGTLALVAFGIVRVTPIEPEIVEQVEEIRFENSTYCVIYRNGISTSCDFSAKIR